MRLLLVVPTTLTEASNEIDVSERVYKLENFCSLMSLGKKSGNYEGGIKTTASTLSYLKASMPV
jgi:hypothetical protein